MRFILKRKIFIQWLILLSIYLIPIFSINEQLFFYGLVTEQDSNILLKIGKDIIFILIYIEALVHYVRRNKYPKYIIFFSVLFILIFSSIILTRNIILIMGGLRWCHLFFLILFLHRIADDEFLYKFYKAIKFIFYIHISSQIFELFVMPPLYGGISIMGLTARVPGIFTYPSTAAVYTCSFYLLYLLFEKKKTFISLVLIFASLAMAMSSTGVIIALGLFYVDLLKKLKSIKVTIFTFLFIIPVILINLDSITGRNEGDSEISGKERISILSDAIENTEIISTSFGSASNTAYSLNIDNSFIADSALVSIYVNLGLLGFIILSIPLLVAVLYILKFNLDRLCLFVIWSFGVSLPTIIMESFPANIIMAILINYFYERGILHKEMRVLRSY